MDGWITIGTKIVDKLDEGLKKIKKKLETFDKQNESKIKIDADTSKTKQKIENLAFEIEEMVQDYNKMISADIMSDSDIKYAKQFRIDLEKAIKEYEKLSGEKLHVKSLEEASNDTRKIDLSMSSILRKVAKWTLAIFGVRSAYSAIRSAMSIISQYDEKMANDIEYIRYALASVLEPVVRAIVDLVAKLLQYVNYLAKAWFGHTIFKSAKDFENMKKSSAGVAKNAKEINKQLAGFDEMNILSDTSSSSASSGGGTTFDLGDIENFEAPKWLETVKEWGQWIIDHWKEIAIAIGLVGAALIGIKIAKWISDAKKATDVTKGLGTSFTGFFDGLGKGIEAIAILGGFALVIKSITDLIDTFSESGLNLTDVLGLMATIVGSIIVLITALTIAAQFLQNPMAMGGLLVLTGSLVAILLVLEKTLPSILDACAKFINNIGPFIIKLVDTIYNGIEKLIYAIGTVLPPIIESVGGIFEKIFSGINKIVNSVGNTIINIFNTIKSLITTVLNSILGFINKLGPAINNFVNNAIKAVTKLINFMVSGIEYLINTLIIKSINTMIKGLNKLIPGSSFDLNTVSDVKIPRFTPKLAVGGIISQPGRGVPIGGQAIGGEAGREGVIPLTDSQAMSELGRAIGEYIRLNATIPIYVGNRQIAREIRNINVQSDFVYNR